MTKNPPCGANRKAGLLFFFLIFCFSVAVAYFVQEIYRKHDNTRNQKNSHHTDTHYRKRFEYIVRFDVSEKI